MLTSSNQGAPLNRKKKFPPTLLIVFYLRGKFIFIQPSEAFQFSQEHYGFVQLRNVFWLWRNNTFIFRQHSQPLTSESWFFYFQYFLRFFVGLTNNIRFYLFYSLFIEWINFELHQEDWELEEECENRQGNWVKIYILCSRELLTFFTLTKLEKRFCADSLIAIKHLHGCPCRYSH